MPLRFLLAPVLKVEFVRCTVERRVLATWLPRLLHRLVQGVILLLQEVVLDRRMVIVSLVRITFASKVDKLCYTTLVSKLLKVPRLLLVERICFVRRLLSHHCGRFVKLTCPSGS